MLGYIMLDDGSFKTVSKRLNDTHSIPHIFIYISSRVRPDLINSNIYFDIGFFFSFEEI